MSNDSMNMIIYIAYSDLEFENATEHTKVNTWMREEEKRIWRW